MKKITIILIALLFCVATITSFFLFSKTMWLLPTNLPNSCDYSYECGVDNKAACVNNLCVRCRKVIDYENLFDKMVSIEKNEIDYKLLYFENLMLDPNTRDCFVVSQKDRFSSNYDTFIDVSEMKLSKEKLEMEEINIT